MCIWKLKNESNTTRKRKSYAMKHCKKPQRKIGNLIKEKITEGSASKKKGNEERVESRGKERKEGDKKRE